MVKITLLSTVAALATVVLSFDIPSDQQWMIVDTHTPQPDCLKGTNRKCDVIDFAQITHECSLLTQKLSEHVDNISSYNPIQFVIDTSLIAQNWLTTARMINASLPLDANHDFYQRMAVADMIHWTQHLPLFTVFKTLVANKNKLKIPSLIVNAGIRAIYTQSNQLAEDAFNYLPTEPPIIRQQIGNLRQWLTDEFEQVLKEFPLPTSPVKTEL